MLHFVRIPVINVNHNLIGLIVVCCIVVPSRVVPIILFMGKSMDKIRLLSCCRKSYLLSSRH
jgi:hypothetical protein